MAKTKNKTINLYGNVKMKFVSANQIDNNKNCGEKRKHGLVDKEMIIPSDSLCLSTLLE